MAEGITVRALFEKKRADWKLEILAGENGLDHQIASPETNFLGLALAGFFEYFPSNRLQILDLCESEFIKRHGVEKDIIEKIFSYEIPAVVVVKNIEVPRIIIDTAGSHDIPLLRTSM